MPCVDRNKCLNGFTISSVIVIVIITLIFVGALLYTFSDFNKRDSESMTESLVVTETTTSPLSKIFSQRTQIKQDIFKTMERLKSRGYDVKDILKDLALDLDAKKRGEDPNLIVSPGSRTLDSESLRELRQHLSKIRLDSSPGELAFDQFTESTAFLTKSLPLSRRKRNVNIKTLTEKPRNPKS